jgi:DNA-binding transcriptional regulator YhcF (GntR family)
VDLDLTLDAASAVPPYEQLRSRVAAGVHHGSLPAGARLPTVRRLAEDLGLAVNTVAKAYRALEADGVIETRGRAGTFVSSAALSAPPADVAALADELATGARRQGLTLEETQTLLERAWSGSRTDGG